MGIEQWKENIQKQIFVLILAERRTGGFLKQPPMCVRAASAPQTAHATEPCRTALWEKRRSEALQRSIFHMTNEGNSDYLSQLLCKSRTCIITLTT